jgi:hypothetical protein|tara:strand:- start:2071 stop:2460 length:390 start_codon:yes stop_codon:yes gene_type:complete
MASSTTSSITALGGKLVVDLAIGASNANNNVTSASSGNIHLAYINNTANSVAFYLKVRDAATATPSTSTANGAGTPHLTFCCPAYQSITYIIPGGHAYAVGVSIWGTTGAAVGNTTASTNSVIVKMVCS